HRRDKAGNGCCASSGLLSLLDGSAHIAFAAAAIARFVSSVWRIPSAPRGCPFSAIRRFAVALMAAERSSTVANFGGGGPFGFSFRFRLLSVSPNSLAFRDTLDLSRPSIAANES